MTVIYNDGLYDARVYPGGSVVVSRTIGHISSQVCEKGPQQEWRDTKWRGCPPEIKRDIWLAWKKHAGID